MKAAMVFAFLLSIPLTPLGNSLFLYINHMRPQAPGNKSIGITTSSAFIANVGAVCSYATPSIDGIVNNNIATQAITSALCRFLSFFISRTANTQTAIYSMTTPATKPKRTMMCFLYTNSRSANASSFGAIGRLTPQSLAKIPFISFLTFS